MKNDTKATDKNVQQDGGKTAFACKLKAARERTGKNQSQFFSLIKKGKSPVEAIRTYDATALKSSISYNQYEIAKNYPTLPELRRLAFYCNVSADELLGMYDAKYFCRLIKKIYPDTTVTTTDQPLAPDEWPNDANCKLQIKVTAPGRKDYYPSIDKLESIRKNCWEEYQTDLTQQIASHLHREIFRETLLKEEFNYTDEQLGFLKKLSFLALNETLQTPVIESTQTARLAFATFCKAITSKPELYEGCFQSNIDIAICFYLMTNINPASAGNRIPALFKFYALQARFSENPPPNIPAEEVKKALSDMSTDDSLLKQMNPFSKEHLSYFKGSSPFDNEFYRFLLCQIESFIDDNNTQNEKASMDDSGNGKIPEYNQATHINAKTRFLSKLVEKGKYLEDGHWKAFTDYQPAFFGNDNNEFLTAEEVKRMLNKELFGAKPAKSKDKQRPGLRKNIHKDEGHGGY